MNIDDMQAGSELDALIAREVMGWTSFLIRDDIEGEDLDLVCMWQLPLIPDLRPGAINVGAVAAHDWSPSTNIAHAWEVLERCEQVLLHQCGAQIIYAPSGGYKVKFGESGFWSNSEKAPLAICRAALKAVRK